MKVQHWVKSMHNRPERQNRNFWIDRSWISDSHTVKDGKPKGRPSYRVGDLLVMYLTEIARCPAVAVVEAVAEFDPAAVEKGGRTGDGDQWGWVTEIKVLDACHINEAPKIEAIGVERKRMQRRSRLRIDRDQFRAAELAIRKG